MSELLLETREVQNLLSKVSGLDNDKGDKRVKRIVVCRACSIARR